MTQLNLLRKPIAIIVAFMLMVSCIVIEGTVIANDETEGIWTGATTKPTKGSGTVADPYLIETPEQFAYMIQEAHGGSTYDKGSTYKLVNDIYLNDISAIDWTTGNVKPGYTVNEWTPTFFSGIIYGNGHMVYGMYVDNEPADYTEKYSAGTGAALISENWVSKWIEINDMGMDYVYVDSANTAGVFVANTHNSSTGDPKIMMNGCYIGSNVSLKGYAAGGFVGGGSGVKAIIEIKNSVCLATGFDDNGRNRSGGILGDVWTVTDEKIENCYSAVKLYGNNQPGTVTNTYAVTAGSGKDGAADPSTILTADNMQGYDVLTASDKMPTLGSGFKATETYPVPVKLYEAVTGIWGGSVATEFSAGKGTENDPYLISTGSELALAVKEYDTYWNVYYRITADIYLNDISTINFSTGEVEDGYTPNTWISEGLSDSNSGWIDGGGHTIYGLYVNEPDSTKCAALFPYTWAGLKINDLGMDNVYINTNGDAAAFVGRHKSASATKSSFTNCFVGENVNIGGNTAAGFIAYGEGTATFKNCYSLANLTSSNKQGGFTGDIAGLAVTADNCYTNTAFDGGSSTALTYSNCYAVEQTAEGLTALSTADMQKTIGEGNKMVLGQEFASTETYPVLKEFIKDYDSPWNGLGEYITKGSGSAEDPYIIETPGQLAYAVGVAGNGKTYKLANDIYLNDIDKIDWLSGMAIDETGYAPKTWFSGTNVSGSKYKGLSADEETFTGTLDANGYTVYGLWYDADMTGIASGLIPAATKTTVKNLTLSYAFVVGGRFTGPVSAYFNGTMTNVASDKTVTVCAKKNAEGQPSFSLSGLVGYSNGITLRDCGFSGRLFSYNGETISHTYGLIGTSWGTKIDAENCYSIGFQPFTVSISTKSFDDLDAANAYQSTYYDIYKVKNVYTDTYSRDNSATYKYDSDGIDTDGDEALEYDVTAETAKIFTFDELGVGAMEGVGALENMPALSNGNWSETEDGAPVLSVRREAHGDVDNDGEFVTDNDILLLRKALIGAADKALTDADRSGNSDICDLVNVTLRKEDVRVYRTLLGETQVRYTKTEADLTDYVLIYPAEDENTKEAAERLQAGLKALGAELELLPDTAEKTEKEIVIGNTNRTAVATDLDQHKYEAHISGQRFMLAAGCDDTLSAAVDHYIKLADDTDKFYLISGYAYFDPYITLSNGRTYSYVWGDEFNGTRLNYTKWSDAVSGSNMGAGNAEGLPADIKVLSNSDVIKVVDGNLRLTPIPYTDPEDENIKYGVPASVRTNGKMAYRYGYAEIRAKVPFKAGLWPSFWTGASKSLGERYCYDYSVEVDVFEIFGTSNEVVPQIHKWYDINKYDYNAIHGTNVERNHTQGPSSIRNKYIFEDYENLSDEYHTYGFEWTPTEMSMYVDGYCYQTYDITTSYDLNPDMSGFQDARYIIFNNHVFTPNSKFKPTLSSGESNLITDNEENLPANYDIDYFHLYQSNEIENTKLWTK